MKIDLSKLPEGTKWIAIDEDWTGEVSAFDREPYQEFGGYYVCDDVFALGVIGHVKIKD